MLTLRSRREIRLMRQAGLVVWRAHRAARRAVVPGATTADVDAAVEMVFAKYDVTPLFKGYPGPIPFPAVTCTSVNEQVVHGIPGDRVLVEGDIVSVDTGCRLNGWCGDSAWTYPVGRIGAAEQQLLDVTEAALNLVIQRLGEREWWSEIATELAAMVRGEGFSVVEEFVGHGIGREMHEQPKIPNFPSQKLEDNDFRLQPGLVIAVEPMVNAGKKEVKCLPDHWTQVTSDGRRSAHFEHTLAVTTNGARPLTGPPETDEEWEFVGGQDEG